MLETAMKMLHSIQEAGFQAYIVGGFVRDYLLNIHSNDVDLATDATPKELKEIFQDACLSNIAYGSVTVLCKNIPFEITTFRREFSYADNRRPSEICYIHNLEEDLRRRDFTINTICMNQKQEIIDLLGGCRDLEKKVIRAVGDPYKRLQEDVLRILRAIRFATTLQFHLSEDLKHAILDTKYLLAKLSINRKKEELDKIFSSPYVMDGISLLKELGLDEELNLRRLYKVRNCSQVIGIWTMLEVDEQFPFTKNELSLMKNIRLALKDPSSPLSLYYYGLYSCVVAGEILGVDKKDIHEAYSHLPIHRRKEIDITTDEILSCLHTSAGPFLNSLYSQLERKILLGTLKNERNSLLEACKKFKFMVV